MNSLLRIVLIVLVSFVLLYLLRQLSNSRHEKFTETVVNIPVDASAYVTLYDQVNSGGNAITFRDNKNILDASWNRKVAALGLGPYTKITLYDSPNFKGNSVEYVNKQDIVYQVKEIKDSMQNKVSSFVIQLLEPHIIAFSQTNLGGYSKVFSGKVPVLGTDWSGKVVSFTMSPYTKVTVYSRQGFDKTGDSKVYVNNTGTKKNVKFVGIKWKNAVNSIKIERTFKVNS
jgi:hypothetical protein